MTKDEYKPIIAAQLAQQNVNALLEELSLRCAEIDALKAKVAELTPQPAPFPPPPFLPATPPSP